jgi:hypothetical protein
MTTETPMDDDMPDRASLLAVAGSLSKLASSTKDAALQAATNAKDAREGTDEVRKLTRVIILLAAVIVVLLLVVIVGGTAFFVGQRDQTMQNQKQGKANHALLNQITGIDNTIKDYTTGPAAQASASQSKLLISCVLARLDEDLKGTPVPASCAPLGIK